MPQQVDDRLGHQRSPSAAAAAARAAPGQRGEHGLDGGVVVGGGDEPGLVRRRGEVDPRVEHRVEERGERRGVLGRGVGEVADRSPGEEHREHRARALHDVGYAGLRERLGGGDPDRVADLGEVLVDALVGQPQRGETGGRGDRVARQRAGLVDGPLGRQHRHHLGAAAERRGREAAAHHLAEGHQVGRPALRRAVEPPVALARGAEARHHLVGDEERAVASADLGEEAVEAGLGRDDAHVARRRLGDQAGDALAVLGERRLDGRAVVVGQHHGQRRRGLGDAGRAGHRERRQARTRRRPAACRRARGSSRRTSRPRHGR